MSPKTISSINQLPVNQKREIYSRMIPPALLEQFSIPEGFIDENGEDLLTFRFSPGSPSVEMILKHQINFPDPIQYGHLTDTLNGQIHILLYILNDPESPRYDVDKFPNGQTTTFGTMGRNIDAEIAALEAGLAPGQVRHGLRMLSHAIKSFEVFVSNLEQNIYFVEPLYYHNAVIFEKYGFTYQKGRKLMERIQSGFSPSGDLTAKLDSSTPFRTSRAADSVRLRSWAIHDYILAEPFSDVTMYKYVGKSANIRTCFSCTW
ncbi:MAG: hypothetical protein ACK2UM_03110 [Anaerolineales bacterium]